MIQNIRQSVHTYVDELDDDFLRAVHAMLETYTQDKESIASYDIHGNPKTVSELQAELAEALAAGKRGEGWTLEQLKTESDKWLTRTK